MNAEGGLAWISTSRVQALHPPLVASRSGFRGRPRLPLGAASAVVLGWILLWNAQEYAIL